MPKKIRNVFCKNLTFQKFVEAHNRAKKCKMFKNEVLSFDLNLESNILTIINSIKNETYKIGNYRSFKVFEPKERIIQSLPYRDRIVHQWYVEEFIKPYILPKFINTSFACFPNKGTHKAAETIQKMMRKYQYEYPDFYILKCDIRKFFNSIDSLVLFDILKKYMDDKLLIKFTAKLLFENRPFDDYIGIPIRKLYKSIFC